MQRVGPHNIVSIIYMAGLQPSVWGPCVWRGAIHMIALGYPERPTPIDRSTYKAYYAELWKVLPCGRCSVNYRRHLDELPIDGFLGSGKDLFEWTVRLHNIVNRELNKPEYTVEQALRMYAGEGSVRQGASAHLAGVLVAVAILAMLFFFRRRS